MRVDLLNERIAIRHLIERAVHEQVNELVARRKLNAERVRQTLDRQYLTSEEVQRQAERGTVRYPSRRPTDDSSIVPDAEVAKALHGFDAGAYFVLIDGQRFDQLDAEIVLRPGTSVTFLRLMPLVGG